MRVTQAEGSKGSLGWIQQAVEQHWPDLEAPILSAIEGARSIAWRSPTREDEFAEYRDASFLVRLGLNSLVPSLTSFWPERGPQWDALGVASTGAVLLVEAKAHIKEFCTSPCAAGAKSMPRIAAALESTAVELGSTKGARWPDTFYQYANRLAHLHFLRRQGVDAYLVLVGFLGDVEMGGPATPAEWRAAYQVADYALGLPSRHKLAKFILHAYPEVRQ